MLCTNETKQQLICREERKMARTNGRTVHKQTKYERRKEKEENDEETKMISR